MIFHPDWKEINQMTVKNCNNFSGFVTDWAYVLWRVYGTCSTNITRHHLWAKNRWLTMKISLKSSQKLAQSASMGICYTEYNYFIATLYIVLMASACSRGEYIENNNWKVLCKSALKPWMTKKPGLAVGNTSFTLSWFSLMLVFVDVSVYFIVRCKNCHLPIYADIAFTAQNWFARFFGTHWLIFIID